MQFFFRQLLPHNQQYFHNFSFFFLQKIIKTHNELAKRIHTIFVFYIEFLLTVFRLVFHTMFYFHLFHYYFVWCDFACGIKVVWTRFNQNRLLLDKCIRCTNNFNDKKKLLKTLIHKRRNWFYFSLDNKKKTRDKNWSGMRCLSLCRITYTAHLICFLLLHQRPFKQ